MRPASREPDRIRPDASAWRWLQTPLPSRWGRVAILSGFAMLVSLLLSRTDRGLEPADDPVVAPDPVLAAVRVQPRSPDEREALLDRAADVWSEHVDGPALDVVLDPAGLQWLHAQGLPWQVLVPDVMVVAEAERARLAKLETAKPPTPEEWFSEYRDLPTIHAHLEDLAALRPDLAHLETIGRSLERRPLLALRIHGTGPAAGAGEHAAEPRASMLIDGGLHAREWISMMVTTCVADRLLRRYDHDPRVRRFVDGTELVVVPVVNPDGYVHSWQRDRYWRKNRRDGHGVDLNRNFGWAWGGQGSSDRPASQVYRGTAAFSEPEAAALRALVDAERFDLHIDFHAYGQLLLHPWSHTRQRARDHQRLSSVAKEMAAAIRAEHGERYRLIAGASLYPAAGTLMDWAYGTHDVASFVIELRPRGGTGFVLPPEQIVPTCDEGFAAVLALGENRLTAAQ